MKLARRSFQLGKLACLLLVAAAPLGCPSVNAPYYGDDWTWNVTIEPAPECDANVVVGADSPALIVNDPAALQKLALEDTLAQLLSRGGDSTTTPLELLQRLFDSTNDNGGAVFSDGTHCDSPSNAAHVNGPAADCPRSEGVLAASAGMLTEGDLDYFYPVAAVNRFDLTPLNLSTCGEYRIVYAKKSGLTDPNNRVFLIFEAALLNPQPGDLLGCRRVAAFWKGLEDIDDPAERGEALHAFFFQGLSGFGPVIDPAMFGLNNVGGATYYGASGQIRVSQHMDAHWEMREVVVVTDFDSKLRFEPKTVGNNPLPQRFDYFEGSEISPQNAWFAENFAIDNTKSLAAPSVEYIRMTARGEDLSGESALGGPAVNDYVGRAANNTYLHDQISAAISNHGLGTDCPPDDPLTSDSILRRATMESCAGCHAPAQFLGPERKLGCGLTWPASLGEVHIDEQGNLSPALKEVFLPHRAAILTTYMQACSSEDIMDAISGKAPAGTSTKSLDMRRTLGGSSTH